MNRFTQLLLAIAASAATFGCATTKQSAATAPVAATPAATAPAVSTPAAPTESDTTMFNPPDQLTATLTNGDVILHWRNNVTTDGGNWVEFATPGSEYTKLEVFLSDAPETTFTHPRVAPETQFIYHIQPFFGRPSAPVEITTGEAPTNPPSLEEGPLPPETNQPAATAPKISIRSTQTFASATPTNLTATLSSPITVDLRWTDTVSDEDGYLVEVGSRADGRFLVCALLPADTDSFRKIALPPKTTLYFRVRPFFYGKPSETTSVLTPPELKSPAENAIK